MVLPSAVVVALECWLGQGFDDESKTHSVTIIRHGLSVDKSS
jgi:hypothetical protein